MVNKGGGGVGGGGEGGRRRRRNGWGVREGERKKESENVTTDASLKNKRTTE